MIHAMIVCITIAAIFAAVRSRLRRALDDEAAVPTALGPAFPAGEMPEKS